MLANINIQQKATGCFLHVTSPETTSINNLLKDAEASMRQTKQQGGGKLVRI